MTVKCPICKKDVQLGATDFPFCSERCRFIDLGAWLSEQRAIPGDSAPVDEDTGQTQQREKGDLGG